MLLDLVGLSDVMDPDFIKLIDHPDVLYLQQKEPDFYIWSHIQDDKWFDYVTGYESGFREGDPEALAVFFQWFLSPKDLNEGLIQAFNQTPLEINLVHYRRLYALKAIASHTNTPLGDCWPPEWEALRKVSFSDVLQRWLIDLEKLSAEMSYAGVCVARCRETFSASSGSDEFARKRLFFDPLFKDHDTPLTWSSIAIPHEVFFQEMRAELEGNPYSKLEGDFASRVHSGLDQLEILVGFHPEFEKIFSRLESLYSLTCCGSKQWVIENSGCTVIQIYQFC